MDVEFKKKWINFAIKCVAICAAYLALYLFITLMKALCLKCSEVCKCKLTIFYVSSESRNNNLHVHVHY